MPTRVDVDEINHQASENLQSIAVTVGADIACREMTVKKVSFQFKFKCRHSS